MAATTGPPVAGGITVAPDELGPRLAELDDAAQARQAEQRLTRELVAGMPVAMLTTDRHGSIRRANPAAAALLELPEKTLLHKPFFAYVDLDRRRLLRGLLMEAVQSGRTLDRPLLLRRRSGEVLSCHAWLSLAHGYRDDEPRVRWVLEPEDAGAARVALVELCRLGVTDADLESMLARVTVLAVDGVTGADAASVLLGDPAGPELLSSTSRRAQAMDGAQFMAGTGPTFEAYRSGHPVCTPDAGPDRRWPQLADRWLEQAGARSCLAIPLLGDRGETLGVLTLYSRRAAAMDLATSRAHAEPFARAAESLVRDSKLVGEIVRVRDELREALTSRAVIDQAKGMIMMSRRCSADEAFAYLRSTSNARNRKVRALAQEIVDAASRG